MCGGGGLQDYSVSQSLSSGLWILDFGLGFGTQDLDLGLTKIGVSAARLSTEKDNLDIIAEASEQKIVIFSGYNITMRN